MNVKELQKIFTQALNFFGKYKPSDLIICDFNEEYKKNYWRAHPYLTVENGKGDFDTCGIRLSPKARGGQNEIMTPAEFEEFVNTSEDKSPKCTVEIREVKKLLTDASRELEKYDDKDLIDYTNTFRAEDATKPFITVYDESGDEDFHFISLNNFKVVVMPKEDTVKMESKEVSFDQLKKHLIGESISAKREIFEYADIWIEDQINIDNPNYTFKKMREYASHESEINYKEIAKGILERFPNMSDEARELLEEFVDSPILTDIVVDAFDEAIEQQAASLDPFA